MSVSSEVFFMTTRFSLFLNIGQHDGERFVDDKVGASLQSHKEDMLKEIGNMFEKISGNTNLVQTLMYGERW